MNDEVSFFVEHAVQESGDASALRKQAYIAELKGKEEWLKASIDLLEHSHVRFGDSRAELMMMQKHMMGVDRYGWSTQPVLGWISEGLMGLEPSDFRADREPSLERLKFERPKKERLLLLEYLAANGHDIGDLSPWIGVAERLM